MSTSEIFATEAAGREMRMHRSCMGTFKKGRDGYSGRELPEPLTSKFLEKTSNEPCISEAHRPMGRDADGVGRVGVGCELAAALSSRPAFCGCDEKPPDSLPSGFRLHKPSLQIGNGRGSAAFREESNRELGKADGSASLILRDKNGEQIAGLARVKLLDLVFVFHERSFRPQRAPHASPCSRVLARNRPDDGLTGGHYAYLGRLGFISGATRAMSKCTLDPTGEKRGPVLG